MVNSIIKFQKQIVKITLVLFLLSTSLKIAHQLTHLFDNPEKIHNHDENHDNTTHCKICDEINAIKHISSFTFYALICVAFKYLIIRVTLNNNYTYHHLLLQSKTRGPPQILIAF